MSGKYSNFLSRLNPDTSGHFREYSRKWLLLAGAVGIVTGILTILLDLVVRVIFLGNDFGQGGFTGLVTYLYNQYPVASFILPFVGIVAAGLVLRKASAPNISGTDELLSQYHNSGEGVHTKEGSLKYIAAILTIGLGGSAGLEGPSISAGGVVASWVWRHLSGRLSLTKEDLRILLLAGASAGIAAIFKAPLTGIVFALEVPYKDDLARRAFLPSIISGVASYVTFASVEGATPLFTFATTAQAGFNLEDIVLSAVLGIVIGLLAVGFSSLYHLVRTRLVSDRLPRFSKYVIGGVIVGAVGLFVRSVYGGPFTYGPGYFIIQQGLSGGFTLQFLAAILVLRMLATAFTLGAGGVGGIFFPLVVFGSLAGSFFGLLVHGNVVVFACVGIASFMSAGYKTPLAAVTFIGDTTGSVSFLIPAMVGSAIAYIVSGDSSVSAEQRLWATPAPP